MDKLTDVIQIIAVFNFQIQTKCWNSIPRGFTAYCSLIGQAIYLKPNNP